MSNNPRNRGSMEERLRAGRPELGAPEGFTDRVMVNLPPRVPSVPSTARRPAPNLWPRFALGLASIGLIAVVSLRFGNEQPGQGAATEGAGPQPVAPTTQAEALSITLPRLPAAQIEALSVRLDQPLEKELENVISDTRLAIQFVASNFLPEK